MSRWVLFLLTLSIVNSARGAENLETMIMGMAKTENHRLEKSASLAIHPTEDSLYRTISWKEYSFVSRKQLKHTPGERYFFKYSVGVLTFSDSLKAMKRLDSVNAYYLPEDRFMKKTQFGIRAGNQVLFLTTHPMIYVTPLRGLYKKYCARMKADCSITWGPLLEDLLPWLESIGFAQVQDIQSTKASEEDYDRFDILEKRNLIIKSGFPSSTKPKSFFRLRLEEEVFRSYQDAQARLDSMRDVPADLSRNELKKFPLKRGIKVGDAVFTISADSAFGAARLELLVEGLGKMADERKAFPSKGLVDSLSKVIRE